MNNTPERQMDSEYVFKNGKWTKIIKPLSTASDGCTPSRSKEMTDEQVSTGVTDTLVSPNICSEQTESSLTPYRQEDVNCSADEGVNISNTGLSPSQSHTFVSGTISDYLSSVQELTSTGSSDTPENCTNESISSTLFIATPAQTATSELNISDMTPVRIAFAENYDIGSLSRAPHNSITEDDKAESCYTDCQMNNQDSGIAEDIVTQSGFVEHKSTVEFLCVVPREDNVTCDSFDSNLLVQVLQSSESEDPPSVYVDHSLKDRATNTTSDTQITVQKPDQSETVEFNREIQTEGNSSGSDFPDQISDMERNRKNNNTFERVSLNQPVSTRKTEPDVAEQTAINANLDTKIDGIVDCVMADHKLDTNATIQMDEMPKNLVIQVPCIIQETDTTKYGLANCMSDAPTLTRTFPQLDVLELKVKIKENNSDFPTPSQPMAVQNDTGEDGMISDDYDTNFQNQTHQNYNVEKESDVIVHTGIGCYFETQFPFNSSLTQSEISYSTNIAENNVTEGKSDTQALIPDFQEPVREVPQINEKGGKAQSQMGHNDTPVAREDLGNSSTDTEGFSLTQADVKSNCEVSNELWLDACQFLPGEEDRELIFDEWGHSPTRNSPDYTKGSSFPWDTTTAIGQSTSDSKLWRPPVERWSSSDSWASALSDWFQSVTVLPEGFISTTVAGDSSQSKSNMAIQDQVGEQRPYTESGKYSGQMCLLNTDAQKPGVDKAQTTTVSQGDNPIGQLSALGDEESSEESCFTLHLETGNTKVATKTHDMETTERAGLSGLHASEIKSVLDVPDEKMPSLLPNNEKSAKQPYLCIEQQKPKPERNAFGKVTEDSVSQLQLDSKEEGERSYGSLKLSDYPSSQALPPGCVCACGEEQQHATDGLNLALHTRSQQFNKYVSTETGHLTHTRGPETDEGGSHAISSAHEHGSYVCFWPEELHVNQAEESSEAPQFVMPFAPLSFGNSYFHYADKASEKDQACVGSSRQGQPPESWAHDFSEKATPLTLQGTYHRAFFKPICDGTTHESKEIHEQQSLADRSGKSTSSGYSYISKSLDPYSPSSCRDLDKDISEGKQKVESEEAGNINNELSKLILLSGECFLVSAKERIAYVTLDLDNTDLGVHLGAQHEKEILPPLKAAEIDTQKQSPENKYTNISKMPHKTSKSSSESKTRSKHKDKSAGHQLASQTSKKQENLSPESQARGENKAGGEDETVAVIETIVITEKITTKPHGKKKKKHGQHVTVKPDNEPLKEVENGARPKSTQGKIEGFEAKLAPKSGKTNEKTTAALSSKKEAVNTYSMQKACAVKAKVEVGSDTTGEKTTCSPEPNTMCPDTNLDDDIIKKRRIEEKSGTITIRTKPQLPEFSIHLKKEETTCKKAYSEVVKQKPNAQREAPRVVQEIQAAPVPGDPQSISLWCEISSASGDASIKWTKEGAVLSETKRGAGENGSISLTILKVCSKDLGIYQCCLSSPQGSVTTDYHLTSEVLSELVIPVQKPAEPTAVDGAEENVQCAPLLFKDDFLCQQYFGEKQPASILTEKVHFGEGMHRKAFRTTLRDGMLSVFTPGHPCVLKVHNAISYGTKNNDELVQKNYNLAVEECYVQNTAREYIKAYNDVAKSAEAFGEVPEIIPIYLVHRPSNDIPYATLEEELIGDFVKYSVKDGKEINLMRRDSEAGQKCCAFQHWVYQKTEGNLLVTDMQGVGMKLTDVGIATSKKGYKGFRGNCGTSFIDQFKALHQCNRFCELLGLTSLQPKPKRTVAPLKPKAPSAPKKKTFNPVLKGKS